jgi:hypothetical protein
LWHILACVSTPAVVNLYLRFEPLTVAFDTDTGGRTTILTKLEQGWDDQQVHNGIALSSIEFNLAIRRGRSCHSA